MRPINSLHTVMKPEAEASMSPAALPQPRSPWHSPVPYLFGGLAAMLGLIAFALLILACSYWRLSGSLDSNNDTTQGDAERDVESGEKLDEDDFGKQMKVYEEKFLVIMAGEDTPTYLATAVSTKGGSINDKNGKTEEKEGTGESENGEKALKEDEQLPIIIENSDKHERQDEQD